MATSTRIVPTVQNPDVVTCNVLVEGTEVTQKYHIVNIGIEKGINKIPSCHITILDGEANTEDFAISNSNDFIPGKKIEIKFGYHNENNTVFKGIIITNTHRVSDNCTEINIECKDETVKMTINAGNRFFNDKTDSDVAKKILDDNNIKGASIESSNVKHEQLVQSNVTDWDYMISRLDVNSMICVIDNADIKISKPELDANAALHLTFGANILEFHGDMDSRVQTSSVKTVTWDFTTQKIKTVESEDAKLKEEGSLTTAKLADVLGQPYEIRTAVPMSQEEQQQISNAKKLKQALSKIKGKVKYQGVTTVLPGNFINLAGVGDHFNGNAFVSSIQHDYSDGDWTTEATLGWDEKFFTEQISPHQAASSTGQASSVQGLHIGIVTDIIDKSGQYRVKLRLPVVDPGDDGIYARMATLDAGKNRGTFFRPEKDDEVIVGFMNNDPRHPVILGMLHSSVKTSPLEPESSNDKKGFTSRSGIKLIFDEAGPTVTIETPGKRIFELNDEAGTTTVKDDNGNKVVMEQSGITVEAAKSLTLKAGASLSLEAPQISIKSDGTVSLEGSGGVRINSSGIMEIKGSLVKIN
jgi:Rhs element Vgr protein